ncbi:chalcone synthase B [Colletotrichum truncatum]|uniref:Chalcone synthase B n=1 Tax=Colletotrichum truncatum TaxID=5467 RepID=A0ACC3YST6_COLTU|nr:chalcone synthase B [Colletotrichum truncatum]KAF6782146.1 chalcone synthase B [Colletotrichum truncatum]
MNGHSDTEFSASPVPDLWITGIGSQYPPYLIPPETFVNYAKRFHDVEKPVLARLLKLTMTSGIETRASTMDFETGFGCHTEIPTIDQLDARFRKVGVDLTVQACRKALRDWGGNAEDITHVIGVTVGTLSLPGYDYLVARKLGLGYHVENMFLNGIGCAGSVALMRVAGNIATAAAARKRPARILCFASEVCTMYLRHQYAEAEASSDLENMDIAGAIFGDAASAFVLCNEYGLDDPEQAKFQLLEWERMTVPETIHHMGAMVKTTGFTSIITKQVPDITKSAVQPLWNRLLPSYREKVGLPTLKVSDFDWALHPGGETIINNVKDSMSLTEEQLRATRQIYKTRGNTGSPTAICVLDLLRNMGPGSDHVVATSFGPGLASEMAFLRRCRPEE